MSTRKLRTTTLPVSVSALLLLCLFAAAPHRAAGRTRTSVPPLPPSAGDAPAPRVPSQPARPIHEPAATSAADPARTRNHTLAPTAGRTLRLAPTGRWWDDATYTKSLAIDFHQQRRMDQVFSSNRDQLLKLYNNLKEQEAQLDKIGKSGDESQLDQQIDKVSQARTDLQKADTHMLLEIRKQLTPDQLAKLDAQP